jgi:hypothetical protein
MILAIACWIERLRTREPVTVRRVQVIRQVDRLIIAPVGDG